MRVMKKNAEQLAHVWPGGGREDLPEWLAHRVIRYQEDANVLVLKNGVHQVTAGAGDVIVLGQNHTLEAWSEQSFAVQFDVLPEPEPKPTDGENGGKKKLEEKGAA